MPLSRSTNHLYNLVVRGEIHESYKFRKNVYHHNIIYFEQSLFVLGNWCEYDVCDVNDLQLTYFQLYDSS